MSGFASTNDMADKLISFDELGPGLYGYTAEGDPNSGIVIGDRGVLVVDAQATPAMAQDIIARVKTVTDKPITHVVLTGFGVSRQEVVRLIEQQQQPIGLLCVQPGQNASGDIAGAARHRLARKDAGLLQPLAQQRPQLCRFLRLADTGSLQVDVHRGLTGHRTVGFSGPKIGIEVLDPPQQRRLAELAATVDKH